MKKILYLIFPVMLVFAACGSDDGVSAVKRWTGTNDISDFHAYVGATGGAIPLTYAPDSKGKTDSARNVFFNRKMASVYNSALFKSMTVEFHEDKTTCVDSAGSRKTVSTFRFKNDSLFILKGGKDSFVAIGNTDTLYRTKSYARYTSPKTGNDTVSYHNGLLDPDRMARFAGFSDAAAMIDPKDTIIWLNAKYIFK
ncbi:MAG: hypothetical protein LBR26_02040 [Prevotella sp.]|jgi:hypothetical protein|nr:hypothetical protein [Prevotella sp.]